jgi:hypothetical protein
MKKTGRPRGTTIPASFAEEIKRARKTSPNHPQTIGKVDHAHRDDKMEFFDMMRLMNLNEGQ